LTAGARPWFTPRMIQRNPASAAPPRPGAHEVFTVVWAARRLVKGALTLVGGVVFLALYLGTDAAAKLGGTASRGAPLLGGICILAGVLLYHPLAAAAAAWVQRRLAQRGGPPPG
jgi:hypothetical protein